MTAKRVLVIDDEADIRAVAEIALQALGGWEVLLASSGAEGLSKAVSEQPDAILLDVMMPVMDGVATLRALQTEPATQAIPVILMTAKAQASEQRRFAELGVAAVITKPFKATTLANQIAAALGWN
jgi:CheY-like chemotaxis protein